MNFRPMRRFRQQLSQEECRAILERGTSGVLAVAGDEGWPYAVPLSYVYREGKLIFHCATAGHKLDGLRRDGRASFCVIDQDQVVPQEYTTYYRSVIAFGCVRILEAPEDIRAGAEALGRRYHPNGTQEDLSGEIQGAMGRMCILEMEISHMTGKEGRELMERRNRGER